MCGIAGLVDPRGARGADELERVARRMADAMPQRGPDDAGSWADAAAGVGLGHRRLSILDLSPEGHQPMLSPDGRLALVFNGEIYNFRELRSELEARGHRFRGHSDTEIILAAFAEWGTRRALERFAGMFAFALWDREARRLTLARDRLGEKPLYYGWNKGTFYFASEVRALEAAPGFERDIDRQALALLLRFNCIPAPYSIYRGVHKLPPGTFLELEASASPGDELPPHAYWSVVEAAAQGSRSPLECGDEEAARRLEELLTDVIAHQMVADVPVGAFLSGGVDSSTIVALMQRQSARPVRTFTIGFREDDYNEAEAARAVATHLGTDHTELYLTARDALDVVPRLGALYDEPFADSSQIPTYLVSRLARTKVTVSLSGDAGDELFGGYNRYLWSARIWKQLSRMPRALRGLAAAGAGAVPDRLWLSALAMGKPLLPEMTLPLDKIHKLTGLLDCGSLEELYLRLRSHWSNPEQAVLGIEEEPPAPPLRPASWPELGAGAGAVERMQVVDALTYLPDDILAKVDRATMAVSLESRVPFLDHRVVEFALSLPLRQRVREGQGKWLLRQVLYRHVPRELVERPKAGFGVPIGAWLRGELREWAEGLLGEERLRREGYFDPRTVRACWAEHLSGRRDQAFKLWNVLMFQAWLARA